MIEDGVVPRGRGADLSLLAGAGVRGNSTASQRRPSWVAEHRGPAAAGSRGGQDQQVEHPKVGGLGRRQRKGESVHPYMAGAVMGVR